MNLFDTLYSRRKLSFIPLDQFREECLHHFNLHLKSYEYKNLLLANTLLADKLCANYKYAASDYAVIKEGVRATQHKRFNILKKNISTYEQMKKIKTIWFDEVPANIRGQHFNLTLNE